MTKDVVLITGCDAVFYPFMEEALASLTDIGIDRRADIGILDLGLSADQISALQARGCKMQKPVWSMDIPEEMRDQKQLGLIARTALRDYFPGYRIYIWFDADAWAQTPDFFDMLVAGADEYGAAVIRENGRGYRRNMLYNRWWFGHMVMVYGPVAGIRQGIMPAINIGILALADTAPHWGAWISHYRKFIRRRKKINLDQHAFNGAIESENLPHALVPAHANWICTLSPPLWDDELGLLCEPETGKPLSVLHLAGPDKRRIYNLQRKNGGVLSTPLTYAAMKTRCGPRRLIDAVPEIIRYG